MKKIMPIKREGTSCDYHRIVLPFSYLQNLQVESYNEAELVVFNRIPDFDTENFFELRKKYGFKYIVDMDDYWRLHTSHYLASMFMRAEMTERLELFISMADAVTVTNEALYIKAKQLNKNVFIIPNGLPFDDGQFNSYRTPGKARFIYTGGISHRDDVIEFGRKVNSLKVDFTLAGYQDNNEQSRLILNNIPFDRCKVLNNKPLTEYMDIYNDADISLVPLQKTLFNICKSNLKIIEAGCKNMPVIASNILPYYNPLDAKYINYASNPTDWYNIIKYFIKNPNYVKDRGLALGEHVRKHYDLRVINKLREDLYSNI